MSTDHTALATEALTHEGAPTPTTALTSTSWPRSSRNNPMLWTCDEDGWTTQPEFDAALRSWMAL
jgi:hypothetical protein